MARTLGCLHINLEHLLLDLDSPESKQVDISCNDLVLYPLKQQLTKGWRDVSIVSNFGIIFQAKTYFDTKKDVPTDLWISMLHERLKRSDCIKQVSEQIALKVLCIIPSLTYNIFSMFTGLGSRRISIKQGTGWKCNKPIIIEISVIDTFPLLLFRH